MSEQKIYGAICAIMQEVGAIEKSSVNEGQHFKYRGIDDIYNSLNPLLSKHGVFVVPAVLSHTREERTAKSGGNMIYSVLTIEFTFYAGDGSSIKTTIIGEGMDSGDKASNKAMSVALKYAFMQIFCIPTKDTNDPDAESPEPNIPAKKSYSESKVNDGALTEKQIKRYYALKNESGISDASVKGYMQKYFGKTEIAELTLKEYDTICKSFTEMMSAKQNEPEAIDTNGGESA